MPFHSSTLLHPKLNITCTSCIQIFQLYIWVEDTNEALSKPPNDEGNLKFSEKQHRRLQADISTCKTRDYEKLQVLASTLAKDAGDDFTERLEKLSNQWDLMTNLSNEFGKSIEERKAMRDFKKNIDLVKLYITDQVCVHVSERHYTHHPALNVLKSYLKFDTVKVTYKGFNYDLLLVKKKV